MGTIIFGDFEWHEAKAESNFEKHGVSFDEAAVALVDPYALDVDDRIYPDRMVSLGLNAATGVLYVVTTEGRNDRTRIISARKATSYEQDLYNRGAFE